MTIDGERLSRLEEDVNRIMERLLAAATADDADTYSKNHAADWSDILHRVQRIEQQLTALAVKHKLAQDVKVSDQ